jgi:hypothetical protein
MAISNNESETALDAAINPSLGYLLFAIKLIVIFVGRHHPSKSYMHYFCYRSVTAVISLHPLYPNYFLFIKLVIAT